MVEKDLIRYPLNHFCVPPTDPFSGIWIGRLGGGLETRALVANRNRKPTRRNGRWTFFFRRNLETESFASNSVADSTQSQSDDLIRLPTPDDLRALEIAGRRRSPPRLFRLGRESLYVNAPGESSFEFQ